MSLSLKESGIPAQFGKGSSFVGDLVCRRPLVLYGTYKGSIQAGGTILLEKRATIEADSVEAARIIVAGSFKARRVHARSLELHRSARFCAHARVQRLLCEPGAGVMGKISIAAEESGSLKQPSRMSQPGSSIP